ncbi:MAG: hypothetical protein HY084_13815 [Gemmatimonadetes bacterium]|nr:hypothetical protein [Gemmatimonadota bacterium]
MRPKLVSGSCFIAVALLVLALRGYWGSAAAADGVRFDVSLRKVTLVQASPVTCDYLRGVGAVQLCAPAPEADQAFSMLCAALPLLTTAAIFSFLSGVVTIRSPYGAKGTAAALAGASFAAAFAGTAFAKISMPFALYVLAEPTFQFGGYAYKSAWAAVAVLLFAAGLSTTSMMLRHT